MHGSGELEQGCVVSTDYSRDSVEKIARLVIENSPSVASYILVYVSVVVVMVVYGLGTKRAEHPRVQLVVQVTREIRSRIKHHLADPASVRHHCLFGCNQIRHDQRRRPSGAPGHLFRRVWLRYCTGEERKRFHNQETFRVNLDQRAACCWALKRIVQESDANLPVGIPFRLPPPTL